MSDYDAISIGGGLAGCAFAIMLARGGARVALIERTGRPQLKVCGDFLSIEAQQLLKSLNLDVHAYGASGISDLRLVAGARSAIAPLPFLAAGMTRFKLDEMLLGLAAEAGVHVIRGMGATEIRAECNRVGVRTGKTVHHARWAALATGKHNIKGWQRPRGDMTAYKMTYRLTPAATRSLDGLVQLVSYRGGYMGACCVEGGAVTICWLADGEMMNNLGPDWGGQVSHLSRLSPFLGNMLDGAEALFDKPAAVAAIPYGYMRRQIIAKNVYPVGDQLCVIPSFTGDGTSLALSSGIAAARAVLNGSTAKDYQDAFLKAIAAQFRYARLADIGFGAPILQRFAVGAVGAFPSLATLTARLTRLRSPTLEIDNRKVS